MPGAKRSGVLSRLGRGLAGFGLVLLAALSLLSGSDRQSRDFPTAPSLMGWPYDAGAARSRAVFAFLKTGPASAIAPARRAILSDPLSAPVVSMLGRSQLYANQLEQARKTFEVAGQLGWRDPLTQIYWVDQALKAQDFRVAAQRLDALLRQSPDDENRDRYLAIVADTPEGREALAERLKLSPPWGRAIVTQTKDLPYDQILQRIDLMQRTGKGVWECHTVETLTQRLINLGKLNDAKALWAMSCQTSGALIFDGGFDNVDPLKPAVAFFWQLPDRGDADVAVSDDGNGKHSLTLEVGATVSLPIVRQLVVLNRGQYQLVWRTPRTSATQAQALQVSLACTPDIGMAVKGKPVAGRPDTWTQDFFIDGECPARQLTFWLAPGVQVHLADVSLNPISVQGAR